MNWGRAGYDAASETHRFLREDIVTFTAKKQIIQETGTRFKENHYSKLGLFSTSGPVWEIWLRLFNGGRVFRRHRESALLLWTCLN